MARVGVLGAGGRTGGLVAATLVRRGHRPVLLGADAVRLRERLAAQGLDPARAEPRVIEGPTVSPAALADVRVLVDVASVTPADAAHVRAAAREAGADAVDASLDPRVAGAVVAEDELLRAHGRRAVPAAGFPGLVLDLLAAVAADLVTGADELHLATTFVSRGAWRASLGPGARTVVADLVTGRATVRDAGAQVTEPVGQSRRLAWFPRPVGLAHAAGVPGTAPVTVPLHRPDVARVRQYVALPTWRAELLQLVAGAAARPAVGRRVAGAVRRRPAPAEQRRRSVRWAAVAETRGDEGVARAWANGTDPVALTAEAVVVVVEALLAAAPGPGALPPAALGPPRELLDELTERADLRWSVVRP